MAVAVVVVVAQTSQRESRSKLRGKQQFASLAASFPRFALAAFAAAAVAACKLNCQDASTLRLLRNFAHPSLECRSLACFWVSSCELDSSYATERARVRFACEQRTLAPRSQQRALAAAATNCIELEAAPSSALELGKRKAISAQTT